MEPINAEKLQAMNNYKKSTTTTTTTTSQFVKKLILYSLISLIFGLVCSYPYWFPSLCFSMEHFLFTTLPCIWSFLINAKCLFILGNFIVIILIGESKLACSRNPVAEVYDEYVERSRIRSAVIGEKKKLEDQQRQVKKIEEGLNWIKKDSEENNKEDKEDEEENSDEDDKEINGEEESGLPAEELNKRVEEFIAKVNKQRCLEAKL